MSTSNHMYVVLLCVQMFEDINKKTKPPILIHHLPIITDVL